MEFQKVAEDVFLFQDTCNVYVIRNKDKAILIDCGTGKVAEYLNTIGVKTVEWVLFTHHHREQCQGHEKLGRLGARFAGPESERPLFEKPVSFRKMAPALSDAFTVHGASYVRPPVRPLKLDRGFQKMDDFEWSGIEFWCVETSGDSPGSMSYLFRKNGNWLAFTGDVMLQGGKMHHWFDCEWDYGFGKGIYALHNSLGQLEGYPIASMFPSHGTVIQNPARQLAAFREDLRKFTGHYLRGWEVSTFAGADQDRVSQPTSVPHVWQVSKHIYKFRGPEFWPNFHIIIADDGHALVVDCGLFQRPFLDKAFDGMKARLGLKKIDALVVTHMHGDHCLEALYLREKYGAKLWTMDRVAPPVSRPLHFDYCAQVNTYGKGIDSILFDKLFQDGEKIAWRGFEFQVDWMPGQTEFALCLHGVVDGKKVAFTGDNLFGSSKYSNQAGHEAVVSRNSCILEESYIYAGEYLARLKPDLILGGHSWVIDNTGPIIDRYLKNAVKLRDMFQKFSKDSDYRWMFDPYWVRMEPYRIIADRGNMANARLHLRNFERKPVSFKVTLDLPDGIQAEPSVIETMVAAETTATVPVVFRWKSDVAKGTNLIGLDITKDGRHLGQLFDAIAHQG